jgi:hypothetical protein
MCSVFTIVLATLVIVSLVSKGPVIFLKLSESRHGQIDAIVTPKGVDNVETPYKPNYLNYTAIKNIVGDKDFNISPRKVFPWTWLSKY